MSSTETLANPPAPFRAIADLAREHAQTRPDAPALRHGDRVMRWAELDMFMDRVATALQRDGVQPRQTIAICASNGIEYAAVFMGALRAGVAVAPLTTGALPVQIDRMVADCAATHLFADGAVLVQDSPARCISLDGVGLGMPLEEWLAVDGAKPQPVEVQPDWPFNIIYSSGTTGTPKGIVQPHQMRWGHVSRAANYGFGPHCVTLIATPMGSNTTLVCFFPTMAQGGCAVFGPPRFDAAAWLALAARTRATHAMLVPVQYQRVMAQPGFGNYDLSSFQMKFSTSAPFSPQLKADVLERWPGGLVETYGMTEGGGACMLECHNHPDKLHTVGKPVAGHDLRVIDEDGREVLTGQVGEVVGRSNAMMSFYLNQPEQTREAEWYDAQGNRFIRTGDVGRFDAQGFLTLMDRRKDMIISGGFNIYPSDLEAVLRSHPDVADAAVVGVPSDAWGETPVAFVVPRRDADAQAMRAWVNERLGKSQRLSDLRLVAQLPRSDIGKVLKRNLREIYAAYPRR